MSYTRHELLNQWMLRKYMIPLRTDCTVSRVEEGDSHAELAAIEMDDWYNAIIDTGDPMMIEPLDITAETTSVYHPRERMLEITLPPRCRRVIELSVNGTAAPVIPVTKDSPVAMLQKSPYSCGGLNSPVAVAATQKILLYAAGENGEQPVISCIKATVTPDDDGIYRLTPAALSTIPKDII